MKNYIFIFSFYDDTKEVDGYSFINTDNLDYKITEFINEHPTIFKLIITELNKTFKVPIEIYKSTCECGLSCPNEAMHDGKCPMCIDYLASIQKEDRMVQVTREMAKDACDPKLEGQWIPW